MDEHKVLLFYKYVAIDDPQQVRDWQYQLCQDLELRGRLIVATEGINVTLEGESSNVERYLAELKSDERFADIHIKSSAGTGDAFPRLSVKVRPEIVAAKLESDDINPNQMTGKYLQADELHRWFEEGKEFYIVDMRNDYEHRIGHFSDSVLPSFENFRDLQKILPELEHLKDKKVVTVCTGGVRCEKASGFLVKHGFSDVYQLYGGIQTYMERYPNQNFKGKLYVFDGRIAVGYNTDSPEHEVISECDKCGTKSDHYVDCAYIHCNSDNRHFIACEKCVEAGMLYCSDKCRQLSTV